MPSTGAPRRARLRLSLTTAAIAAAVLAATQDRALAQEPSIQDLLDRIAAQDKRIEALETSGDQAAKGSGVEVGYKNGYFIRSTDPNSPFELRINGRMQFRLSGFDSDSNGKTTATVADRNDFEIERGRLEFRGTFLDTDTHFYINLNADYGKGYADLEHHEELAVRVGGTVVVAIEDDGQVGDNREADQIRLSSGQSLANDLGADKFDVHMAAFDAAMKYRGFSLNSELFFRTIDSIVAPTNPRSAAPTTTGAATSTSGT